MAGRRYTLSSPCTRGCAEGYSLIELLVVLAVSTALMGAALSVALSSRQSYTTDQHRTRINQNLRASLDLVGIEIRQAGERLPSDVPALEIVNGEDGAADSLILRRNLLDEVLPLCERLNAGATDDQVRVATSDATPPQGCDPLPDEDGNGWPDNIDAWRAHRDGSAGQVRAYVFNPVDQRGEWFLYDSDPGDEDYLGKGDDTSWQFTYEVNQQCRIYMLEEREYRLQDGLLQFVLDGGNGDGVNLGAEITNFQARAILADGTVLDALDSSTPWSDLRAIELTISGESEFDGRIMARTVSARFFPRNILSN